MNNRKLIKIQSGELVLSDQKGNSFVCPYQNALLIPGNLQGQLIINRPPCSSACSLFYMEPVAGTDKIRVTKNCCPQPDIEVLAVEDMSSNSSILQ